MVICYNILYIRSGMRKVASLPWTPGSDAAGTVEEVHLLII